jgi:hypothetical protein
MRHLLAILMLLSATPLAAEEFTTDTAKAAEAAYEADLKIAREKYSKALDESVKQAVEAGDLEEVKRIVAVKEGLEGKAPVTEKDGKVERVLWKHKNGYFERLNDGHWIERIGTGNAAIFSASNLGDEYIELNRPVAIVRLYDDHCDVLFRNQATKGFKRLYKGEWSSRP